MGIYMGETDVNMFCGQPTGGAVINNQDKSVTPTESQQSVTADPEYTGLGTVTVGAIDSEYVGSDVPKKSSSDLTASGATVSVPKGYYENNASKAVASGSATVPDITQTSATVSTGTNTLTLTKSASVTPTVTAGYVSSGTARTATIQLTGDITTKSGMIYQPSTTDRTIASGTYLTGIQTINGVTTSNLTAENIKSGTIVKVGSSTDDDCIAYVVGTYSGGGSSKNVQFVQNSSTRITATSYTKACGTITVSKAGTYDIYWCAYRTSSSGTWGTQWYKNGVAQGTAQTSFTNSYYQAIHLTNITLAQNDTIDVYGRSRGSNYYLYVGQLTIIEV